MVYKITGDEEQIKTRKDIKALIPLQRTDLIGVVLPICNEEESLSPLVKEIIAEFEGFNVELYLIFDRKTSDSSYIIAQDLSKKCPSVKPLFFEQNRSVAGAYILGYKHALSAGCDWILEMDAGFSHAPSDIRKFIEAAEAGYTCVFGSRFCHGGTMVSLSVKRILISRIGTKLCNYLCGTKLSDMTSGFELFHRDTLQYVLDKKIYSKYHFFQTEIRTICRIFPFLEIPITYSAPSKSVSDKAIKDSICNLIRLAFDVRMSRR